MRQEHRMSSGNEDSIATTERADKNPFQGLFATDLLRVS